MDYRHDLLVNVLDRLRHTAPSHYGSYHSDGDYESIQRARSKTLIHLFLFVKFGVSDFETRHDLITDGPDDGGVDAYYFYERRKILYLIQSKFSETNASRRGISADELIKMEIGTILRGNHTYQDRRGQNREFNDKIKQLQEKWRRLPDQARYQYKIVVLGGQQRYNDHQIRRLLGLGEEEPFEFYDYERIYEEILFPFCASNFYDPDEIVIELNLQNKEQSVLRQSVMTQQGEFQIRVTFIPVEEIGRVLSKYKNAILKYNPRNYLSLSKNPVNRAIREGILNSNANDFAIYNNGITMLCSEFMISETTGKQNRGQIILEKPQIINGGQTAYVLSEIYEDGVKRNLLTGKEVLLKAIIIPDNLDEESVREFIAGVSNATNQQSKVEEADRRSNDEALVTIQKQIFQKFGYLLERKRGELYTAIEQGYVDKGRVIDRVDLFRAYLAYQGNPSEARRSGKDRLFQPNRFRKVIGTGEDYKIMLFSALILTKLRKERNDSEWSNGFRYGKFAVVAAVRYLVPEAESISPENLDSLVSIAIERAKAKWSEFETWVQNQESNIDYKRPDGFDFDNYYKGKTIDQEIKEFFGIVSHI